MESSEVYEKVMGILKPYAKNQKGLAAISEKSRIIEDLGVNSARMIDIVADLEEQFGVRIEDEVADKMDTVGNMIRILEGKPHG